MPRSDIFSLFNNSTISIPRFFDFEFFIDDYDLLTKANDLACIDDFINIGKYFIKEFNRVPNFPGFLDERQLYYTIVYTFSEDANRLMMRSTKFSEAMEYCVKSIEQVIKNAYYTNDMDNLIELEYYFFKIVGIIFFKYLKRFNFTFQCDDGYTTHIYVNAPHLCPSQKKCYKRTVRNRFNVKV